MNKMYLIATMEGGVMECPQIIYTNYQIVHTDSQKTALKIYDRQNGNDYYKGVCMAKREDDEITVLNKAATYSDVECLGKITVNSKSTSGPNSLHLRCKKCWVGNTKRFQHIFDNPLRLPKENSYEQVECDTCKKVWYTRKDGFIE